MKHIFSWNISLVSLILRKYQSTFPSRWYLLLNALSSLLGKYSNANTTRHTRTHVHTYHDPEWKLLTLWLEWFHSLPFLSYPVISFLPSPLIYFCRLLRMDSRSNLESITWVTSPSLPSSWVQVSYLEERTGKRPRGSFMPCAILLSELFSAYCRLLFPPRLQAWLKILSPAVGIYNFFMYAPFVMFSVVIYVSNEYFSHTILPLDNAVCPHLSSVTMITFLPLIYYLSLPSLSTLHYLSTGFTILFYSILFYFILYFSISTYFCTHYWFPFFSISTFPHPLSLSPLLWYLPHSIVLLYVLSCCFRIINVSSAAHIFGDLEAVRATNDLMLEKTGAYQPWPAYGNLTLLSPSFHLLDIIKTV